MRCLDVAEVMVLTLDLRGEITFINQKGCRLLEGTRDQLIGLNWFDAFIIPSERERMMTVFQQLIEGKSALYGTYENRVRSLGGQERVFLFKNEVVVDEEGEPKTIISSGQALSEVQAPDLESARSHQALVKIFDAMNVAVYVADIQSHELLFVNQYVINDCGPLKRGTECWRYLQAGQEGPCEFCNNDLLIDLTGNPTGVIRREVQNTVTQEHYETLTQAIRWHDGRMVRLEVATNIEARLQGERERQQATAHIQYAQKLESLGVLAGGIAHDFNNLLMTILGNVGLAMCDTQESSPVRESLVEIEGAAKRAAELCRQMLAYSGRGRFIIEQVDLRALVEEMSHLLQISISKKAVLKFNFAAQLPRVSADATQLRQVIVNLVTNASEAIGDASGLISLSTGVMDCDAAYLEGTYLHEALEPGMYAYIEVADTGCGMDGETQRRIFDPFFTTKFTGRGLGLSAVLGIARAHCGAVKVYSEAGRGTTFKLLLPVAEEEQARFTGPLPQLRWRGEGLVLMVDDEPSVRALGRKMLERMGFRVEVAADGREAVEIFEVKHDEICGVLMDLTMPRLDGEQAFREMRRVDRGVRVVLSSGYNEQEVVQRFMGKSLAGFIQKPYQFEELVEVIRAAGFRSEG